MASPPGCFPPGRGDQQGGQAMTTVSSSTSAGSSTTTPTVNSYTKTVADNLNQSASTATDIGWVQKNVTRTSVLAELTPQDSSQYFMVRTLSSGPLLMGANSAIAGSSQSNTTDVSQASDIHIQVMDQSNHVIADSGATSGKTATNYAALRAGTFTAAAGTTYTIKVTKDSSAPKSSTVTYGLQFKMGSTYTNDYVTKVAPPAKNAVANPLAQYQQADPVTSLITNVTAAALSTSTMSGLVSALGGSSTDMFSTLQTSVSNTVSNALDESSS
jgi:hypothetical protein